MLPGPDFGAQAAALAHAGDDYFRILFEQSPDGILVTDAQSNYLDANPRICAMLGYAREQLVGMHSRDVLVDAEHAGIDATLEAIWRGREHKQAWRFRRRDGSMFDGEIRASTLADGRIVATIRDIGDRRETEAIWRRCASIVDSSEDSIISTDFDHLVTSWNRGAERMTGYAASEMIGASLFPLLPVQCQPAERELTERLRRGESVANTESTRLTRDGSTITVSMSASPIRDALGQIVGASRIARDISQQKQHEAEIMRLTRMYSALSGINQAIVWKRTREGLFEGVCKALVEQGGFCMTWVGLADAQTERLIPIAQCGDSQHYLDQIDIRITNHVRGRGPAGTAFRENRTMVCNDTANDPVVAPWRDALTTRGWRACAAIPIRSGEVVWGTLNVYADQTGFFRDLEIALLEEAAGDVAFALDNFAREEERIRIDAMARQERQFSETMIESMPGILYFYDANGKFLRWNRNFERVTGYSAAQIGQMTPGDFFGGDDRSIVSERIAEVFESGASSVEAPLLCADGSSVPYFMTGRLVAYEDAPALVGMGIDVSERKRAEEALRELAETLEHKVVERTSELHEALVRADSADRLKSAFLASMSHELRTPLNSIIGFTGILKGGLAGPINAEQEKQLGMVQTSARHLLELINDVLDISKIEAGQLEVRADTFDLRASVLKVAELIRPLAAKKGIEVTISLDDSISTIRGDRRRVEQVLLNLVGNAVKFTVRGSVAISATTLAGATGDPSRARVAVGVRDTGMGIKREDLAIIFTPFRQLDVGLARTYEGTGLGLAICERLAVLMGGRIDVESEWTKGSTFTLVLPAHAGSAA